MKLASEGGMPYPLGESGCEKSSISLFMMMPPDLVTNLEPQYVFTCHVHPVNQYECQYKGLECAGLSLCTYG